MRKRIALLVVLYTVILMGCNGWSQPYTVKLRSLNVFPALVTSRSFLSESSRIETHYSFVTEGGEFEILKEDSDTTISISEGSSDDAYVDIYFQTGVIRNGNRRLYEFHVPKGFTVFSP